VGPEEVLARLACRRSWPSLPSDPLTLLRIATRTAWDLTRPRDWGPLPDTVERLMATLAAAGASVRDAA
jgi:hypothetical protein